jgi:hypothetical protein
MQATIGFTPALSPDAVDQPAAAAIGLATKPSRGRHGKAGSGRQQTTKERLRPADGFNHSGRQHDLKLPIFHDVERIIFHSADHCAKSGISKSRLHVLVNPRDVSSQTLPPNLSKFSNRFSTAAFSTGPSVALISVE